MSSPEQPFRPGPERYGIGRGANRQPRGDPAQQRWEMFAAGGDRVWDWLNGKRIRELFHCPADEEFSAYFRLLKQHSSARYRDAVFIGLDDGTWRPRFVNRSVLSSHGYILGRPGEGKSSSAVAQLLLQLACEEVHDDERVSGPPILIIDCKPQGEQFLRNFAAKIAERRSQRLGFFSNNPAYTSLWFDPFRCVSLVPDDKGKAQMFLKALSLIHPESQDAVFFMNEQRLVLEQAFSRSPKPRTYQELVDRLEAMTREKGGNLEARGAHAALQELCGAPHVRVDGRPVRAEEVIDFERFLEERQMLYLHLDTAVRGPLSKAIGKLALYGLLLAALRRREQGKPKQQAYVFIDEFHQLAAANVVDLLTVCRDAGISMILAHQSSSSLVSRDADLFSILFEVTGFQQYFTVEDENIIRKLEKTSSRVSEWLRNSSVTEGFSTGSTANYSDSVSSDGVRVQGSSGGYSSGTHRSSTEGWSEHKIPGLTPEVTASANGRQLLTVTRVKGEDDSALTPTFALPTLVQLLRVVPAREYHALANEPWPTDAKVHRAPREQTASRPDSKQHRESRVDAQIPTLPEVLPPSDLLRRLERMAARLRPHMTRETKKGPAPGVPRSVNQVAQSTRRKVADVVACARAMGINVEGGSDFLTADLVAAVMAKLKESGKR